MLRNIRPEDAPAICEIYNHYVLHTPITFEVDPVAPQEMRQRILNVTETFPWLVWEVEDKLLGYAYAARWKERVAYLHSVEAAVYLQSSSAGKGGGSALLDALLAELRGHKVHCAIDGIALPNDASVALLQKFGFRKIAHFNEVGFKFSRWIDVGYWQLLL